MFESPILVIFFLIAAHLMTGISFAIRQMGKEKAEAIVKHQKGLAKFFFRKSHRDRLSYAIGLVKNIFLLCFTVSAFIVAYPLLPRDFTPLNFAFVGFIVFFIGIVTGYLFRVMGQIWPITYFKFTCQVVSFFLIPFWPIALFFHKIFRRILPSSKESKTFRIKDKILELLHDQEFKSTLDAVDQKLILSFVSFKERIAREVMVPRIDMFTLSAETSIKEAAQHFISEGYSRIPIWKENVDNIIGTLYYKDLFSFYSTGLDKSKQLDTSVEQLIKPIVYTPETKKISQLLQEFRSKQIHLALVVDEYGGTEGIVTIEDILEELVGDIADEYDFDEESLYTPLSSGGWIVDAKMTILSIEDDLGVVMPQSPEYDTIGGFIFHKAGTIPSKGWRFHHDNFDLEVLSSSDRTIEKIKITPV